MWPHFLLCVCVDLRRQLIYVKQCCEGEPEGDGVAALTSEERTRWALVNWETCALNLMDYIWE